MNESMNRSDILQEIKKSLNFIYGIHCDYINDELLKMERCKGKLPPYRDDQARYFQRARNHRILAGRLENRGEGPEWRAL